MTDNELKFFDPETGKPLHRVPEGATIPAETPYGCIYIGSRVWFCWGGAADIRQIDGLPRFTRKPIAPPAPPLPTEPGYYTDKDGDLWKLRHGEWCLMKASIRAVSPINAEGFAPFTAVTLVPTETWDRLRVLDPDDTRDRVDAAGGMWRYERGEQISSWAGDLADAHEYCGPLRFADEVSGNE